MNKMSVNSPSKYTSLARLILIQESNCVGENGIDYDAEELESLIWEKQRKKDDEQEARELARYNEEPEIEEMGFKVLSLLEKIEAGTHTGETETYLVKIDHKDHDGGSKFIKSLIDNFTEADKTRYKVIDGELFEVHVKELGDDDHSFPATTYWFKTYDMTRFRADLDQFNNDYCNWQKFYNLTA